MTKKLDQVAGIHPCRLLSLACHLPVSDKLFYVLFQRSLL